MKILFESSKTAVKLAALATALGLGSATSGWAAVMFAGFSANDGGLSASATFADIGGGILQVTIANTEFVPTPAQQDVLCALFFSGADGLSPVLNSAVAPSGSLLWQGTSSSSIPDGQSLTLNGKKPATTLLGEHWEYKNSLSGMSGVPNGATEGISCVGLNIFGASGNFFADGKDQGVDGSSYGILSTGYGGQDGGGLKSNPYIQNSIVFELNGFTGSLSSISNVTFQYGSSTSDPSFAGLLVSAIPEPNYGTPVAWLAMFLASFGMVKMASGKSRRA